MPQTTSSERGDNQPTGQAVTTMSVTAEPCTRAELEEAIQGHRATLARMPAHWTDRRASIHAKIDQLLTDWEAAT